jgi:hypothetical protein
MAKSAPQLEWCIVRLGDDHNWWVEEVSDAVRWDVDGLSIIDPRQVQHIIELVEPLRDYAFEQIGRSSPSASRRTSGAGACAWPG